MSNITSLHISSAANWLTHELVHFLSWQILPRRKTCIWWQKEKILIWDIKKPLMSLTQKREGKGHGLTYPVTWDTATVPTINVNLFRNLELVQVGRRQKFQPFNILLYSVFWKTAWQHPRLSTYDSRSNIMEVYIWNCWKDVLTKWVMRFNIEILISNQGHLVGTLGTCLQLSVNDNMII